MLPNGYYINVIDDAFDQNYKAFLFLFKATVAFNKIN